MTAIQMTSIDLYCDGCGKHLLLEPSCSMTVPQIRRMAREEDGWATRRAFRNRLGNLVGSRDLCAECK